MDGSFACPECGCEIRLKGVSPGRQVPCDWCRTLVEVPYLPRAEPIRRMRRDRARRRKRAWPAWATLACAVLGVAITISLAFRAVRSQRIHAEADALGRLVESSRDAEKAGHLGEALATLEGALAVARDSDPPPEELPELRRDRDRLALKEAEGQVVALEAKTFDREPGNAVGRALTLQTRAGRDPAIVALQPRIAAELERLRTIWATSEADAAAEALQAVRPADAMAHALKAYQAADALDSRVERKTFFERLDAIAGLVIARHGVIIEPFRGAFSLGSSVEYARLLDATLAGVLKTKGYLPRPPSSPWDDLWATRAPFRLVNEVVEKQEDPYLQSPNLLSLLMTHSRLMHGERALWEDRSRGRTQVPVPGLPAYLASRMAVAKNRNPECERILYENARSNLIDRLVQGLHGLPECRPPVALEPASARNP